MDYIMKISDAGLDIIKAFEGFRAEPYLDQAGVPTIGYGSTHYDKRAVTMHDHSITKTVATIIMKDQINDMYGKAVNHAVRVPITQNQFDSLCSFTYNVGIAGLHSSNVLKYINSGRIAEAHTQFSHWVHVNGKVNSGLIRRRKLEAELFIT